MQLSKPIGKFCSFHKDGSFKHREGEYDGFKMLEERAIRDFKLNFSLEVVV